MKKEELMKIEGMTDEIAKAVMDLSKTDLDGMVPKTRLDEVIAERDNAKKDHADVLKQLGQLQKDAGDVQSLKDQIQKMQDDAKEVQKTHDAEIKKLKIDNAVEAALSSAKSLNNKAVKALLNMEGADLLEDGIVKGLDDQIKALQKAEDSKFLFGSSQKMKGAKTGERGNDDDEHEVDTSKMTYSELAAYMSAHPDAQI